MSYTFSSTLLRLLNVFDTTRLLRTCRTARREILRHPDSFSNADLRDGRAADALLRLEARERGYIPIPRLVNDYVRLQRFYEVSSESRRRIGTWAEVRDGGGYSAKMEKLGCAVPVLVFASWKHLRVLVLDGVMASCRTVYFLLKSAVATVEVVSLRMVDGVDLYDLASMLDGKQIEWGTYQGGYLEPSLRLVLKRHSLGPYHRQKKMPMGYFQCDNKLVLGRLKQLRVWSLVWECVFSNRRNPGYWNGGQLQTTSPQKWSASKVRLRYSQTSCGCFSNWRRTGFDTLPT